MANGGGRHLSVTRNALNATESSGRNRVFADTNGYDQEATHKRVTSGGETDFSKTKVNRLMSATTRPKTGKPII